MAASLGRKHVQSPRPVDELRLVEDWARINWGLTPLKMVRQWGRNYGGNNGNDSG